jgi:uncharacterized RDD family membrane protein YckC
MSELRHETVLGIDNVPLDLPLARVGSRALALTVDYLAVGIAMAIWALGAIWTGMGLELGRGTSAALVLVGVFLLDWGYFAAWEIATGGQTLGKRALSLRVVTRHGGRPGWGALLVRNLVRSTDLVVGPLLMLLDPRSRRLGDWLGGCLVVHTLERSEAPPLGRVPAGWGARRVAVAEELVARADGLDPGHALNLTRRVLRWLELDAPEWLAGEPVDDDPVEALRRALGAGGR